MDNRLYGSFNPGKAVGLDLSETIARGSPAFHGEPRGVRALILINLILIKRMKVQRSSRRHKAPWYHGSTLTSRLLVIQEDLELGS